MIIIINLYNIIDDENVLNIEHFFDEKITDYDHIACNIIIENLYESELFELMTMIDENTIV